MDGRGITRVWLLVLVMGIGILSAAAVSAEEQTVSLGDVPASVRSTIEKQAMGAQIIKIEQEMKDGAVVYEAEIVRDGNKSEILVAADGKFLGMDQEEGEDEDHEDGDDDKDDGEDEEDMISWDQLPQAVQQALREKFGGAQPAELKSDSEDGFVLYEAEYDTGGTKQGIKLTEDGAILEIEEEVSPSSLPAGVLAQIKKKYPGASIKESEMVVLTFYEVEVEIKGKEKEVKLFANGLMVDDDD